jgi:hypothetical protein
MLSRLVTKRFCHQHFPKSKCYENIHKLQYLREDVNEIKEEFRIQQQNIELLKVYGRVSNFFLIVLFYKFVCLNISIDPFVT